MRLKNIVIGLIIFAVSIVSGIHVGNETGYKRGYNLGLKNGQLKSFMDVKDALDKIIKNQIKIIESLEECK